MTSQHSRNIRREQNGNAQTGQTVDQRTTPIRDLNDRLRTTGKGGIVLLTNGIGALGLASVNRIFAAVATFSQFDTDNDPWGEHDFGLLSVDGNEVVWKIDYFDRSRRYHSPDPADPKLTVRVLTVMLAEEY